MPLNDFRKKPYSAFSAVPATQASAIPLHAQLAPFMRFAAQPCKAIALCTAAYLGV
jgi:hypothetical protein